MDKRAKYTYVGTSRTVSKSHIIHVVTLENSCGVATEVQTFESYSVFSVLLFNCYVDKYIKMRKGEIIPADNSFNNLHT